MSENRVRFTIGAVIILVIYMVNPAYKDRVELENRTYVMGMGLDTVPGKPVSVDCTLEIVVWKELGFAGVAGVGGGDPKPTWQPSTEARSITGSLYDLSWLSYRKLSLAHLESIVVGEDFARNHMVQLVSFAERNSEVSGKLQLAITKGRASELMKVKPRIDKTLYNTIAEISNIKDQESSLYGLFLEDISTQIMTKHATYIPWVERGQGDVRLKGLALFVGGKLTAFLDRHQAKSLSFLAGMQKNGIIEFRHWYSKGKREPWYKAYRVTRTKTHYTLEEKDDKLYILVDVWMEGNLLEDQPGVLHGDHLIETQHSIETEVRKGIEGVIGLFPKYGADLAGFDFYLQRYHPFMWPRYEKGWDRSFGKRVMIKVRSVTARIRRVGMIN